MNDDVTELVQQLTSKKSQVREATARVLGEMGDRQAVPHLTQALGDERPKVREKAASALGQLGDEQAVPHLVRALERKGQSSHVSQSAVVLWKGGGRRT